MSAMRKMSPDAPGTTRSGAAPTRSLTTHGSPVASASFTTSPHVSPQSLGRTRQSETA